uniref:Uncharacterized protein n=1 Tax=Ditylenchus dipsaci TaxID=166011 RepID=A0A915DUY6_9BILA
MTNEGDESEWPWFVVIPSWSAGSKPKVMDVYRVHSISGHRDQFRIYAQNFRSGPTGYTNRQAKSTGKQWQTVSHSTMILPLQPSQNSHGQDIHKKHVCIHPKRGTTRERWNSGGRDGAVAKRVPHGCKLHPSYDSPFLGKHTELLEEEYLVVSGRFSQRAVEYAWPPVEIHKEVELFAEDLEEIYGRTTGMKWSSGTRELAQDHWGAAGNDWDSPTGQHVQCTTASTNPEDHRQEQQPRDSQD